MDNLENELGDTFTDTDGIGNDDEETLETAEDKEEEEDEEEESLGDEE